MLTLVIEIGLMVAAWQRGWKAWALLPIVLVYAIAFFFGMFLSALGYNTESMWHIGLVFDVLCIAILIGMVAVQRHNTVT